jgi:hypothetical protein
MTDALAQIDWAARDLLHRVDAVLIRDGAPDEHPIWAQLRELGALPSDVYEFFARWQPQTIAPTETALALIRESLQYHHSTLIESASLTTDGWHGPAADAFHARWLSHAAAIAGDDATLDGQVAAIVGALRALDEWARHWRSELARTVLSCLTSAEAVALHEPNDPSAAAAAARIGARILRVGAEAITDGDHLLGRLRAAPV